MNANKLNWSSKFGYLAKLGPMTIDRWLRARNLDPVADLVKQIKLEQCSAMVLLFN